jgi:hypothetical protein
MAYSNIVTKLRAHGDRLASKKPEKESAFEANSTQQPKKPKFRGQCFNCGKDGHRARDCKSPIKPKAKEESPSTGPLPTPSGGRDLSPSPTTKAKYAIETSWTAQESPIRSLEEILWVIDSENLRCHEANTCQSVRALASSQYWGNWWHARWRSSY